MQKLKQYYNALLRRIWLLKNRRRFKSIGRHSYVYRPLRITGHRNITLGDNVYVGEGTWLAALPLTGSGECILQLGDGCVLGHFNHIYATRKIVFGKKVLTADKIYISDNQHSYDDITTPVIDQPVRQLNDVHIGDGAWLGENVCIMGASVGKNSVIGANAVVTKDIPDYCIAAGNPARVIKRYCFDTKSWRKTAPDGNFL